MTTPPGIDAPGIDAPEFGRPRLSPCRIARPIPKYFWGAAAVGLLVAPMILGPGLMAAPAESMRGPGLGAARRPTLGAAPPVLYRRGTGHAPGAAVGFFAGLLGFYRTVISPVDGDRCSMAPTCSLYSRQALETHGALWGILLTAERLLHEADEIPQAREIVLGGETFYLDPLDNNTYWWD